MSSEDVAVRFERVSKVYKLYDRPIDRLKETLWRGRRQYHRELWALRDVDLVVERGTTVALVGANGSGKSTLLQLVAGILQPTTGAIRVKDRVAALLELGAGFNPEYTGRENALINGAILGIDHDEMKERLEAIIRFADIGEAIDRPVKTYSTGMYIRLAFAIAINVDPEILLIDEALSVGDLYFQHRCLNKIGELQARGKTILFVSHDPAFVVTLAAHAVWLDQGCLIDHGNPEQIISRYLAMVTNRELRERRNAEPRPEAGRATVLTEAAEAAAETTIPNVDVRSGNQKAEILGIGIYDADGRRIEMAQGCQTIRVRVSVLFKEALALPIIGLMIKNRIGLYLTGTNTLMEGYVIPPQPRGSILTAEFCLPLPLLATGNYSFAPAVADGTLEDYAICDWIENAFVLEVITPRPVHGLVRLPCEVKVKSAGVASVPELRR